MARKEDQTKERGFRPHAVDWTDAKVNHLWDYYSCNKAYQGEYFSYQAGDTILNEIARYVRFDRLSAILDYGCGPGFLMDKLLRRLRGAQKCYGLDFSQESVALVEEKYKGNPNYGETKWVESLPSPYGDGSMDLITALEVVEHLNDEQLRQMGHEIYRLLRPGGYILITTPNRENLEKSKTICPECGAIFHRWQHVRTWSSNSLCVQMEAFGFKTVVVRETNFTVGFQRILKYLLHIFPEKKTSLLYIGGKEL